MIHEAAGGFNLDIHIRQHELDALVLDDGFAELHALLGELDRFVERALGNAERLRSDAGTGAVEGGERDLEAVAFLAKQVLDGNLAILQHQLAGLGATYAHLVLYLAELEAGPVSLNHEGADAACALALLRRREDGVDMRDAGVGDEVLHAVEDVDIAALLRPRTHRASVRARAWLGQPVRGEPFATGEVRDEALLLLVGSREQDG